jgi:hypothetical protein
MLLLKYRRELRLHVGAGERTRFLAFDRNVDSHNRPFVTLEGRELLRCRLEMRGPPIKGV